MPRFFVAGPLVAGHVTPLPDDVVRHIHVLRLQTNDPIDLFDGNGGEYRAHLLEIGKKSATAHIDAFADQEAEPPYQIRLAQGVAGGDKMDWLIEKSVELGVAGIVPLIAERGVVRLSSERAARRQTHWQALARAACEQCGRNRVPDIAPAADIRHWLQQLPPAKDGELRLILSPRALLEFNALPTSAPLAPVTLAIGPEAGFSPAEETDMIDAGFMSLSLGPRILRTETAGIAVLAALAGRWGGW